MKDSDIVKLSLRTFLWSLLAFVGLAVLVFVTAFDRYAVQAFEVEAADFLLKPYDQARLDAALDRVRKRRRTSREPDPGRLLALLARLERERAFPRRLFLKHGERTVAMSVADIRWLEAKGKKIRVHAGRRTVEIRDSLKRLEQEDLDPNHFVRISRSAIVNADHIVEIQPWFHGEVVVLLDDGSQVPSTRGYRGRLGLVIRP
jgi:two-component system LytT family response regulator